MIEIAIVCLVVSVVMAAVAVFELTNRHALGQTSAVGSAQERAHRAIERVLHELDGASIATLVPDPTGALGADEIVFQKSIGVTGAGAMILSPRIRIAMVPDDGETIDGLDNNHNGLIDERKLTITYNYGTGAARTVTIAHCIPALFPGEVANGHDDNGNGVVDEKGFNVQRVGTLLTVRLALEARVEANQWTTWAENCALKLRD